MKLQQQLKPYAAVKFELSIASGLLMRGNCIVFPSKLQTDMIEKLHQGLLKCRQRAQHSMWWPSSGKDLQEGFKLSILLSTSNDKNRASNSQ